MNKDTQIVKPQNKFRTSSDNLCSAKTRGYLKGTLELASICCFIKSELKLEHKFLRDLLHA